MTVTLAQLLEDNPKLEVAEPDETVAMAMERMLEHGYTQLPVVSERARPRAIGLISASTIARTTLHLNIPPTKLRVHHAVDEHPVKKRLGDDLWRTLDEVREGEVLLVENDDGLLCGILTGQDFRKFLRRQSEDSITVLDIEAAIKQLILEHYRDREDALDEAVRRELGVHQRAMKKDVRKIVAACLQSVAVKPSQLDNGDFEVTFEQHLPDRIIYDFDRLSFNQYLQIFASGECASAYEREFGLPSDNVKALLGVARDIRNQIMHNRGLPTTAQRDKLIYCRDLLNRVADRRTQPELPLSAEREPDETPTTVVHEPASDTTDTINTFDTSDTEDQDGDGDEDEGHDKPDPLRAISRLFAVVDKADDRVTWPFDALDQLTHVGLPADARKHRSWWTNDEEVPQSAFWREAGWRVVSVNLTSGTVTFGRNTQREAQCIAAFGALFRRLAESPDWTLETPSPAGRTWQNIANVSEDGGAAQLKLAFSKGDLFRLSLYIDGGDKDANKAAYNALFRRRDELEKEIRWPLVWQLLPHKRASRISLVYPQQVSIRSDYDALEELAKWVAAQTPRLYAVLREAYNQSEDRLPGRAHGA